MTPDARGPVPATGTGHSVTQTDPLVTDPAQRSAGFQPMPPLSAEEYTALRDDLAARGVLVPIVVDQHGRLLDGHHRRRIADELGIDCPTKVEHVADDDAAWDLAVTLNAARWQLNREQKRELIRAEIARRPDDSDRAIGRRVGCDHKTVGAVRREVAGGEIPHPGGPYDDLAQQVIDEQDPAVGEALLAELMCKVIADLHEDDPGTWGVLHELLPVIDRWGRGMPNCMALAAVSHHLYAPGAPLVVWRTIAPWLTSVAGLVIEEWDEVREKRNASDWKGPAEELARLTQAVWNPKLDADTQQLLVHQLEAPLAVALADAEWLAEMTVKTAPQPEAAR